MDFNFTTEQTQLKDSVERFLSAHYQTMEDREAARRQLGGFKAETWQLYAELGLLGMSFAEADGGFGGGPIETMIVMEAIGRRLAPEPYMATGVLASTALRLAASTAQKQRLLPSLIEGQLHMALAQQEPQARYELENITTRAEKSSAGWVLTGRKDLVINGDTASLFVVPARTSGKQCDKAGITLFLVPADAVGVSVTSYSSQDGGRLADIVLNAAPGEMLGTEGEGLSVLEQVIETGIAAIAAEAVGVMDELTARTVDYLKTRKQFGITIGSFQALQHKAVDMLIMTEQTRSMAYYAAMMLNSSDAEERGSALSAVKVQVNRSARFVGQTAIQLHGGIGMTNEYSAGHYFKRLTAIEALFGSTVGHLKRVAQADDNEAAGKAA